ncbi:MAG: ABC transporter ATP-binding protein [Candidatus Delongbacteria bacterium]|nr:ABC transporter ATP-binding protein [Candidatus Delongbacteria bacterium]
MKSVKFLLKYLLKTKKYIGLGILFTLLMSIFEIFPGMIYKVIADSLSNLSTNSKFLNIKIPVKILDMKYETYKFNIKDSDQIFNVFLLICASFLTIYILSGLFRYFRDIYFNFAVQRILKDIKDVICRKILNLPFPHFNKNKTGDLMSRITYDVTILHNIIDVFIELSRSMIALLIFLPILFYIDWKISFFAILFFPVSLYLVKYLSRKMKKLSKGISDTTADYTEFIKDKVERIQSIKIAGEESNELDDFKSLTKRNYDLAVRNIKIKFFLKPSNEIIGIFGIVIIAIYFCYLLINKEMGAGNIVLYLSILKSAYKPFKKAAESFGDLHFSLAGADKITTLLDNDEESAADLEPISSIDSIICNNVCYKIEDKVILKDISLKLIKGSKVGVTGISGSGKTSFVNLLPRLNILTDGEILFNEKSLNDLDISSVRSRISFVNNGFTPINGSIFDNLTYGIPEPEKAMKEFTSNFDMKTFLNIADYEPEIVIGKTGMNLSTGQLQKIALINAVLRKPELFIIDEGFDLLSSDDIEQFLSLVMEDSILLVVSRQKFILDRMDKVYKMVEGTIQ